MWHSLLDQVILSPATLVAMDSSKDAPGIGWVQAFQAILDMTVRMGYSQLQELMIQSHLILSRSESVEGSIDAGPSTAGAIPETVNRAGATNGPPGLDENMEGPPAWSNGSAAFAGAATVQKVHLMILGSANAQFVTRDRETLDKCRATGDLVLIKKRSGYYRNLFCDCFDEAVWNDDFLAGIGLLYVVHVFLALVWG